MAKDKELIKWEKAQTPGPLNINIKHGQSEIVPEIVRFSFNEIISKKVDDTVIKSCFLQNKSKDLVVKG